MLGNTLLISNVTIVNYDETPFKGDLFIENGQISKISHEISDKAEQYIDGKDKNWLLLPGYIDMHIHGSAGNDTMDATQKALHQMARSLVQEGVTGFLATTMTQSITTIEHVLENLAQFEHGDDEARLLGIHVEGPFLSKKRAGAQPVEYMILPSIEQFEHWQQLSKRRIKQITVAPELEGGLAFIEELSKQGVLVSIGHSDATIEEVHKAITVGVKQATHLYNQMRPFHHRSPGVVGGVFFRR